MRRESDGVGHDGESRRHCKIENLNDLYAADRAQLDPALVRVITVDDALVDTGATSLSMPPALIERLGLRRYKTRRAKTAAGTFQFGVDEAVRLTIGDRDCVVEVTEVFAECPVLVGQIPLEALDFVVDPVGRRLIGNPDHNGEHMFDLY